MTPVRAPFLPSLLVAGALHAAGFGWLATRPPPPLPTRRPPTTVRLVTRAPAPPPRPVPEPEKPKPPPSTPPPRIASVRPTAPAPRDLPPPAPTPAAAPAPTPPQPRRFAVSMNAVVPGGAGGVAVPVTEGATAARGNPNAPASAPVGDNTGFARAGPVDAIDVEVAPRRLREPSSLELRERYPPAAREARLEADVRLELTIDEAGRVTAVRVVKPAGEGFDEVAAELARRIVFAPATRNGKPLAVRYPWTIKFRLDE